MAMQNTNFGLDLVDPSKTFANFLICNENRDVCLTIELILDSPLRPRKQLYICGAVGFGKTHLAHAIANEWQIRHPTMPVGYVEASILGRTETGSHSPVQFRTCFELLRTVPLLIVEYPRLLDPELAEMASRHRFSVGLNTVWFDTVEMHDHAALRYDPGQIEQEFLQPWKAETSLEFLRAYAKRIDIDLTESLEKYFLREGRFHPRRMESFLQILEDFKKC